MSIALTVNGVVFDYPQTDDVEWGADATDWAAAVTTGMLQKAGGLFQLLAEVDFGTTYGLKSTYFKTRTSNIAAAGQFRLARADVISWRNEANSADLSLGVSSSDVLQFNGADILSSSLAAAKILVGSAGNIATAVSMSGDVTIDDTGVTAIGANKVTNAMMAQVSTATFKGRTTASTGNVEDLTATQATALLNNFVGDSGSGGTKGLVPAPASGDSAAGKFLKADGQWTVPAGAGDVTGPASSTDGTLVRFDGTSGKVLKNSPTKISDSDVAALAAIAYSKLNLSASIVDADIAVGAAIVDTKLATISTAGKVSNSATTAASANTVSAIVARDGSGNFTAGTITAALTGVASGNIANTLTTTTGDMIYASGANTPARLAKGTQYQVLNGGSSVPTWGAVNLDQATAVSGILPIGNGGTGNAGGAWTGWTPTVTISGATSPSAVNVQCAYMQIGKTVIFRALIQYTYSGSATGLSFTLPTAARSGTSLVQAFVGRNSTAGFMLQAIVGSGTTTCSVFKYDNTVALAASNNLVVINGVYEAD